MLITAAPETLRARLSRRGREDAAAGEAGLARLADFRTDHAGLVTIANDGSLEAAVALV